MLRIKKNSDGEKRIVIVNLYCTVTVEFCFMSVNGSMWLSSKHAIMFSGVWCPFVFRRICIANQYPGEIP